jgi:hypothetical protein
MKRFLGLFAGLILLSGVSFGALFRAEQVPDKTVVINYEFSISSTIGSTTTLIVDLSSTTAWPHSRTKGVKISAIRLGIDAMREATGTIKLGVITHVGASTGSVTWFHSKRIEVSTLTYTLNGNDLVNFTPLWINAKVDGGTRLDGSVGTTPFIMSNDTTAGTTDIQDDSNLPSPDGDTFPGLGDIVMEIKKDVVGAMVIVLQLFYHGTQ